MIVILACSRLSWFWLDSNPALLFLCWATFLYPSSVPLYVVYLDAACTSDCILSSTAHPQSSVIILLVVLTLQLRLNHGLTPGIQQCVCAGFFLTPTAALLHHFVTLHHFQKSVKAHLQCPCERCEVGFSPLLKCPL